MAEHGDLTYVAAAVQVIPILVIAVMVDPIHRADAANRRHRAYASASPLIGLTFGVVGEIAGLQALLTGVSSQTLSLVDAGLAALAATALLPRVAELLAPSRHDTARRVTNIMLPTIIGGVGIVWGTLHAPLALRLALYLVIGIGLAAEILTAISTARNPHEDKSVDPSATKPAGERAPTRPPAGSKVPVSRERDRSRAPSDGK